MEKIKSIIIRYITLVLLLFVFLSDTFLNILIKLYSILAYIFLNIFSNVSLENNVLIFSDNSFIYIISESIAPSVFILMSLVFFTMPYKLNKLYLTMLKSFLWFNLFNIIRVFVLVGIYVIFDVYYFQKFNILLYQGLSEIVAIIIIGYYFKKEKIIKEYPVHSDIQYLLKLLKVKIKK